MNAPRDYFISMGSEWQTDPYRRRVLLAAGNVDGYYSLPIRILSLVVGTSEQLSGLYDLKYTEWQVGESISQITAAIDVWKPDILALSMNVWNRDQTVELAAAVKNASPNTTVVVGGQEVTGSSIDYFDTGCFDFIIDGEGEIAFEQFLSAWDNGRVDTDRVSGLWYRENGQSVLTRPAENVESLDDVPSPIQANLIPLEKTARLGVLIEGARGCPYRCSFCFEGFRNCRVRMASPKRIRDQIVAAAQIGARTLHMLDPILCNSNHQRLRQLTSDLRDVERLTTKKFTVSVEAYAEHISDKVADCLDGHYIIDVGLQSTHPPTLEAIHRRFDYDRFLQGIQRLKERQLFFNLYLITALPYETMESWLDGVSAVVRLQPTTLFVNQLCLLNGTELRHRAEEYGYDYDRTPPYTVRSNNWLSRNDLVILDRMSWDVSRRYNLSFRTLVMKDSPLALRDGNPETYRLGIGGACPKACDGCAAASAGKFTLDDLEPLSHRLYGSTVTLVCGRETSLTDLRQMAGGLQFAKVARIRLQAPFDFFAKLLQKDVEDLVRSGIWFFYTHLDEDEFHSLSKAYLSVLNRLRREVALPRRGTVRPYVELAILAPNPLDESNYLTIGKLARNIDALALPLCERDDDYDFKSAMARAAAGEYADSGELDDGSPSETNGKFSYGGSLKEDCSFLLKLPGECIAASFEEFKARKRTIEIMNELELLANPTDVPPCFQPTTGILD